MNSVHADAAAGLLVPLPGLRRTAEPVQSTRLQTLYKSMVRFHLDYCRPVWSPYRKRDIEALEKA